MTDIYELQKELIEFRDIRDWNKFHNPKDIAISLNLEASELLEHFQWKDSEAVEEHIKSHKDEIGEELADVFNWVLILSHELEIDILEASKNKIHKNAEKYPVAKAKGNAKKYTDL